MSHLRHIDVLECVDPVQDRVALRVLRNRTMPCKGEVLFACLTSLGEEASRYLQLGLMEAEGSEAEGIASAKLVELRDERFLAVVGERYAKRYGFTWRLLGPTEVELLAEVMRLEAELKVLTDLEAKLTEEPNIAHMLKEVDRIVPASARNMVKMLTRLAWLRGRVEEREKASPIAVVYPIPK